MTTWKKISSAQNWISQTWFKMEISVTIFHLLHCQHLSHHPHHLPNCPRDLQRPRSSSKVATWPSWNTPSCRYRRYAKLKYLSNILNCKKRSKSITNLTCQILKSLQRFTESNEMPQNETARINSSSLFRVAIQAEAAKGLRQLRQLSQRGQVRHRQTGLDRKRKSAFDEGITLAMGSEGWWARLHHDVIHDSRWASERLGLEERTDDGVSEEL